MPWAAAVPSEAWVQEGDEAGGGWRRAAGRARRRPSRCAAGAAVGTGKGDGGQGGATARDEEGATARREERGDEVFPFVLGI